MDEVTQQNAALVEAAAVAESLEDQARTLVRAVSMFRLSAGCSAALPVRSVPTTSPVCPSGPARPAPKAPVAVRCAKVRTRRWRMTWTMNGKSSKSAAP